MLKLARTNTLAYFVGVPKLKRFHNIEKMATDLLATWFQPYKKSFLRH